jgi:hypothetical protein
VIEELLTKLDLPAKLALITGAGLWATAEAPQIGLRALHLPDGPACVRGWVEDEREHVREPAVADRARGQLGRRPAVAGGRVPGR